MLNKLIQAAAEGLPKLSRRSMLGGMAIAAIPSAALASDFVTSRKIMSPEQRIAAAVQEIEAAMAERFPDFKISASVEDKRPLLYQGGSYVEGDIHRAMVMIYAHEDRNGPEVARWFVDYPKMGGAL